MKPWTFDIWNNKVTGKSEENIPKDTTRQNIPHLEINEVDLIHFNIVNDSYQQHLGVLYTFAPKKIIWSIIRNFTNKFYISKDIGSRFFLSCIKIYWSKF